MTAIPDSDLLEILQEAGQVITVGSLQVYAMYSNEYAEELGMAGTRPQVVCRTTDVAAVVDGTVVVVGTTTYAVRGIDPARTGLTRLVLELQT